MLPTKRNIKKYTLLTFLKLNLLIKIHSKEPQIKLEEASDLQLIKELETQIAILSDKYIDRNNIC